MLAQAAQQRRVCLDQAVTRVTRQRGVHPDTLRVWLVVLDRPAAGASRRRVCRYWGCCATPAGCPSARDDDHDGQIAYLCYCPTRPVIAAQVAHLHVLAAIGDRVRRLVQAHGLAGLAAVLTTIRLDDTGTVTATVWRSPTLPPPLPHQAGPTGTAGAR